jgi:hypothetical protein
VDTEELQPATPEPKLRWYQYRLRSLFVLTLLVAIGMSWLATTMREQRREYAAAKAVEKMWGWAWYKPTWLGRLLRDESLVTVTAVGISDFKFFANDPAGRRNRSNRWPSPKYVRDTKITDSDLVDLEGLSHLTTLCLANLSTISDGGMVHVEGLSELRVLYLELTNVSDAGLVHLGRLDQLIRLDLQRTKITDAGLVHLRPLRHLQQLNLQYNRVADAGLVHLQELKELQMLVLSDTKVSDAGLVHLQRLGQLRQLYLNRTNVTNDGVRKLHEALPHCAIENWN